MNDAIHTEYMGKDNRVKIEVYPDIDPMNPRGDYNLGVMYCEHRRYSLGDQDASDPRDDDNKIDPRAYPVVLPLYLMDHSGLAMQTSSADFRAVDGAGWDWGMVGVIYVTRETILKEFDCKRITAKVRQNVIDCLKSEVEVYSAYLSGDCYGYTITDAKTGDNVGGCWGFYGDWKSMLKEARSDAQHWLDTSKELAAESEPPFPAMDII